MQLLGLSKSYDSLGASSLTSVADFVGGFLVDVAPYDLKVEMVSWHGDGGPPRPSLERRFERFEADIRTLPKLSYRSRANILDFRYASRLPAGAAFALTADCHLHFVALCNESIAALASELPRSKTLRNVVDWPALATALAGATAALPSDRTEVRRLCDQIKAAREARRQHLAGTIEAHGVDWSLFHPKARELLDDPFFWDPTDDHAPHGNDIGADLLSDYRLWRRRNRGQSASAFLDRWLLRIIGRTPPQLGSIIDKIRVDAEIALPFAQIKIDGEIEPAIAAAAIAAVEAKLLALKDDDASIAKVASLRARLIP